MQSDAPETNCVKSEREWHVMAPTVYISSLVRLWRDTRPQPPEGATAWQGEVENIQTGQQWQSDSLEEVFKHLRHQVAALEGRQS